MYRCVIDRCLNGMHIVDIPIHLNYLSEVKINGYIKRNFLWCAQGHTLERPILKFSRDDE